MGSSVSSNNGIPKVDASVGTFVEQVASRDKVVVKGIEPDDSSCIKRVM